MVWSPFTRRKVVCPIIAIIISNNNSAIDDNFSVALNGHSLLDIDNSTNTCTGRIYSSESGLSCSNLPGGSFTYCDSGVCSFQSQDTTDLVSLLLTGTNTISLAQTVNNHHNNLGKVKVLGLSGNPTDGYTICKTYLDTIYSWLSNTPGPGEDIHFTYP